MKPRKSSPAREHAPARRPWAPYAAALAALIVLLWAYGPALNAPFLFDDTKQRFALPSASNSLAGWIGPVRPVLMFTYWANVQISTTDTSLYHLFNVLIHALAGLFVFFVISRLLEWAGVEPSRR